MKNDMGDLKKLVLDLMQNGAIDDDLHKSNARIIKKLYQDESPVLNHNDITEKTFEIKKEEDEVIQDTEEIVEESLSLEEKEKELILKALNKHKGKRKYAAQELGISERTLYRKIKEYDLNEA